MTDEIMPDLKLMDVYAMFWRLLHLNVNRYGSSPSGQLLLVLTIVLLDDANYYPTVSELAEITAQPKSTVSRYVSTLMNMGYVEEKIDPRDGRRRLLHWSESAQKGRAKLEEEVGEIAKAMRVAFPNEKAGDRPGVELKNLLQKFSKSNE